MIESKPKPIDVLVETQSAYFEKLDFVYDELTGGWSADFMGITMVIDYEYFVKSDIQESIQKGYVQYRDITAQLTKSGDIWIASLER